MTKEIKLFAEKDGNAKFPYSEESMLKSLFAKDKGLLKNYQTFCKLSPNSKEFINDVLGGIVPAPIENKPTFSLVSVLPFYKFQTEIEYYDFSQHNYSNNFYRHHSFKSHDLDALLMQLGGDDENSYDIGSRYNNNETVELAKTTEIVINNIKI